MTSLSLLDYDYQDIAYIFDKIDNFTLTEHMTEHLQNSKEHISVLLNETMQVLDAEGKNLKTKYKDKSRFFVDMTFGAGGHTRNILEANENNVVIAIDRDPYTQKFADKLSVEFEDRFFYYNAVFADFAEVLEDFKKQHGEFEVSGVLMDLGFSSMQIDTPRRGFSFMYDGPLDMRMSDTGSTAADIVNSYREEELAGVIFKYGDERKSRHIAKAICTSRNNKYIERTSELAEIVKNAVGYYNDDIHPATRTFQALRIEVNEELQQLKKVLADIPQHLTKDAILAIITFHSGEDKIVKEAFNKLCGKGESFSRYNPLSLVAGEDSKRAKIITKKPIAPQKEEVEHNVRARSSKLRAIKML